MIMFAFLLIYIGLHLSICLPAVVFAGIAGIYCRVREKRYQSRLMHEIERPKTFKGWTPE